jgi:hypothetical protein
MAAGAGARLLTSLAGNLVEETMVQGSIEIRGSMTAVAAAKRDRGKE